MTFESLPNEVLYHIIDQLGYEPPLETFSVRRYYSEIYDFTYDYQTRMQSLWALSLCNRRLHAVVKPFFWATFNSSRFDKLDSFATAINKNPALTDHVREFIIPTESLTGVTSARVEERLMREKVVDQVIPLLRNLRLLCIDRISDPLKTSDWEFRTDLPQTLSRFKLCLGVQASFQRTRLDYINPFLKLESLRSLHVFIIDPRSFERTVWPEQIWSNRLKEIRISGGQQTSESLQSMVMKSPELESYISAYPASADLFFDLPSLLYPARNSLKSVTITSTDNNMHVEGNDTFLVSYPDIGSYTWNPFACIESLSFDAIFLKCNFKKTAAEADNLLRHSLPPNLKHLTLFQCSFETYSRITTLALAKPSRNPALSRTTLQFAPKFPNWPAVIDPVHSLVGPDMRERLAADTKVIEKEYEALAHEHTFTSLPATWRKPLAEWGVLVPDKEVAAREACERNGIRLEVQTFDRFESVMRRRREWEMRRPL